MMENVGKVENKAKKMPNRGKRGKFHSKKFGNKTKRTSVISDEITQLQEKYRSIVSSDVKTFADFPLSEKSRKGLKDAGYSTPTEIQRESIGLALQGSDILGAAKTGSGKTLAFLLPMLECLYRQKWSALDGMGALIISPTRELAYQIFEVLRKIGKYHDFSAGLVIGGKHVKEEAERINRTNIVICTPGRLLQHMDETAMFNADNLQMLVLDEADRILDLGFQQTMNAVIQNLPAERQTLLFSATQTKSVKDLARLSLKDPVYVSVHEKAKFSTPVQLTQSYIVCELHEKLDIVWSFIKNHAKSKILVFFSSCKQVRFVYEVFRRLRPGITVLALHGSMQQMKRMTVYNQFCRKQHAVLFATDLAARGLDFPTVQWVVQVDCPEDASTYIHRVGRTARYEQNGEALLVLLPTEEESMVAQLQEKKIPIQKIRVNQKKMGTIQPKLQSLCAAEVTVKEYAQRAFMSYIKSVFFMSNKKVFDVSALNTEQFSRSLGLAISPRVRFLAKQLKKQEEQRKQLEEKLGQRLGQSTINEPETSSDRSSTDSSEQSDIESRDESKSVDVIDFQTAGKSKKNCDISRTIDEGAYNFELDDDEDDEILKVKNVIKVQDLKDCAEEGVASERKGRQKRLSKYAVAKKLQKMKMKVNTKVVFDDQGQAVLDAHKQQQSSQDDKEDGENPGGIDIEQARQQMQKEDQFDKELYRQKVKERHREQRLKAKEERRKERLRKQGLQEEDGEAILDNNDGSRLDLDELPDPDEMYGRRDPSEEDASSDDSEESDDEDPPRKKQKFPPGQKSDNVFDTGLDLADDEALALKLLQS